MPLSTIDTSSISGLGYGFKNRIINGGMVIDQRNAGASITPTTSGTWFGVDRWSFAMTQSSKFSVQQNAGSVTPPAGFTNYLGITSLSAYTVTSNDYFGLYQKIEANNMSDLGWGSANAQTVSLSFWVRSSLTGSFGGSLQNDAENWVYSFTYTISSANTWTYVTVTVPGPTSGTWLTGVNNGMYVWLGLGATGTRVGTAGAWGTQSGAGLQPSGTVSVVGTSGATFYVTGVQLEKGTVATGFDYRSYGTELALCQRYLPAWRSSGTFDAISVGLSGSTTGFFAQITYQVAPRVPPTGVVVSSASHFTANSYGTGGGTPSSVIFSTAGSGVAVVQLVTTGLTVGQSGNAAFNNASGYLYLTGCEL